MKDEIKAEEKLALKIIDDSNWEPAHKMMMTKIITDAAWSTNGSEDKLQAITETTFRLAFMDVARDKQIDEIKQIVTRTDTKLDTLIKRMDENDKVTKELKESFDEVKKDAETKKTRFHLLMDAIVALGWKGVIWVTVPLASIIALAYRTELAAFFKSIF